MEIIEHIFKVGHKLEALNPDNHTQIRPATVVKVISDLYFIVQLDDLTLQAGQPPIQMCCHGNSPFIFPIHWCMYKGHKLTHPPGKSQTHKCQHSNLAAYFCISADKHVRFMLLAIVIHSAITIND